MDRSQTLTIAELTLFRQQLLGDPRFGEPIRVSKDGGASHLDRAVDFLSGTYGTLFFLKWGKSAILVAPFID